MGILKKIFQSKEGFTLVEVLVSVATITITISGLVQSFTASSLLADMSANMSVAIREAESKMEEIRNYNYSLVTTDYVLGGTPGNTFSLTAATGKGVIYIDSSNASLLTIEIDVSWKDRDGRVIGQDANLNGTIEAGEDPDGNSKLDSTVKIITQLAKR